MGLIFWRKTVTTVAAVQSKCQFECDGRNIAILFLSRYTCIVVSSVSPSTTPISCPWYKPRRPAAEYACFASVWDAPSPCRKQHPPNQAIHHRAWVERGTALSGPDTVLLRSVACWQWEAVSSRSLAGGIVVRRNTIHPLTVAAAAAAAAMVSNHASIERRRPWESRWSHPSLAVSAVSPTAYVAERSIDLSQLSAIRWNFAKKNSKSGVHAELTRCPVGVTVTVTATLFNELFSEESCSVTYRPLHVGLSEKRSFQLSSELSATVVHNCSSWTEWTRFSDVKTVELIIIFLKFYTIGSEDSKD